MLLAKQAKEEGGNDIVINFFTTDTAIFVLILDFYHKLELTCDMYMVSPIYNRHAVDIRATYLKHKDSVPILLKLHAISGCGSVPYYKYC